jgi:HPt (histidine-containing phosphotransfer) domain-containing protein
MAINQELYGSLKKVLAASGQLETIINLFVTNAEERLNSLKVAVSEDDREAIKRIAHSIKGSCSMLGGVRCAELCQGIEDVCHENSLVSPSSLIDELGAEINNMAKFLRSDLSGTNPECCN